MYQLHRSSIIFWAAVSFLLGVGHLPWALGILVAVTGWWHLPGRMTGRRNRLFMVWLILAASFALGSWRYDQYFPDTATLPYDQDITFVGTIVRPPRIMGDEQRLTIRQPEWSGYLLASVALYPRYQYGDVLEVQCRITQPKATPEFAYDKYLARYGIVAQCRYAQITKHASASGSFFLQRIYGFRAFVQHRLKKLYPEPAASLLAGVILGVQDDIAPSINDLFQQTGTIHILVVSGMHVMIIAALLQRITAQWLSPRQRFIFLVVVLVGFSFLTGLSASVIRASAMGLVLPLAHVLGRTRQAHITLAVIAAGMTALNPYILVHDLGFQLSFLATLGLMYFQPVSERLFRVLPNMFWIRDTVTTSFSAMIPTTPLLLFQFGTFSVVSLLANIVVVPVSTAMLFGGVAVLLISFMHFQLALWSGYALWQIIQLTLRYLESLLTFPQAYLSDLVVAPWVIAFIYTILFTIMLWRALRSTVESV